MNGLERAERPRLHVNGRAFGVDVYDEGTDFDPLAREGAARG